MGITALKFVIWGGTLAVIRSQIGTSDLLPKMTIFNALIP